MSAPSGSTRDSLPDTQLEVHVAVDPESLLVSTVVEAVKLLGAVAAVAAVADHIAPCVGLPPHSESCSRLLCPRSRKQHT